MQTVSVLSRKLFHVHPAHEKTEKIFTTLDFFTNVTTIYIKNNKLWKIKKECIAN